MFHLDICLEFLEVFIGQLLSFLKMYFNTIYKKKTFFQIVNGYFVHFFSPPDLQRVPKNVVFVIDRSGSMMGRKMAQV